jgi:hypothetical protein
MMRDRPSVDQRHNANPISTCGLHLCLAFKQLIERAVPLLHLARHNAHPRRLAGFAFYRAMQGPSVVPAGRR